MRILPDGHYCDECRAMAGLVGEIVEVIEQDEDGDYDYIVETKKGRTCVFIDGEDAEVV